MKKQIALLTLIALTAVEMQAPRNVSFNAPKPVVNPSTGSGSNNNQPSGGGNNNSQGPAQPTQAQMIAAVNANPGNAVEAVKQALNQIGVSGSGTVDQTVLNYIMG